MTGFTSKKTMSNDRFDVEDKVYEHEVVTTVRITVRSLSPYLDKAAFLEDYAYLTEFSNLLNGDDYPRVVATSVIEDEIEYMDKEIQDE
jgi:hypothetical protein